LKNNEYADTLSVKKGKRGIGGKSQTPKGAELPEYKKNWKGATEP